MNKCFFCIKTSKEPIIIALKIVQKKNIIMMSTFKMFVVNLENLIAKGKQ